MPVPPCQQLGISLTVFTVKFYCHIDAPFMKWFWENLNPRFNFLTRLLSTMKCWGKGSECVGEYLSYSDVLLHLASELKSNFISQETPTSIWRQTWKWWTMGYNIDEVITMTYHPCHLEFINLTTSTKLFAQPWSLFAQRKNNFLSGWLALIPFRCMSGYSIPKKLCIKRLIF